MIAQLSTIFANAMNLVSPIRNGSIRGDVLFELFFVILRSDLDDLLKRSAARFQVKVNNFHVGILQEMLLTYFTFENNFNNTSNLP